MAKEHLRDVYLSDDPAEAERLLDGVIDECDAEDIPELATLAATLRRWRTEILAHHATDGSNGTTEGLSFPRFDGRVGCGISLPRGGLRSPRG